MIQLSNTRYFQPEIETMPVEQMKALQSEKLVKQVRHVYDNVPYYRAKSRWRITSSLLPIPFC